MKKALITGATSGIGKEIAIYLHSLGWQLILSGRNEKVLKQMAEVFGNDTEYIALDLAKEDAPYRLYRFCQGKNVDLLVNNAGFGVFGAFTDTSLDAEMKLLNVNIRAVHILTKLFLREFERRGSGRILNVASSAGFLTGPMLSSYYASKNYVVRLSLAIREELRRKHSNVTISVLCPGPVNTEFNRHAGVTFSAKPAEAAYVARYAVDNTLRGKGIIIPTMAMKAALTAAKLCPESILSAVAFSIQKKKENV